MKIKTSELKFNALCYAVCMIELPHLVWGDSIGIHHASNQVVVPSMQSPNCYSPYMNWAMCGPIIERKKIEISPSFNGQAWVAHLPLLPDSQMGFSNGPTPLIAAMRCYVASNLGDEVEIPDELC